MFRKLMTFEEAKDAINFHLKPKALDEEEVGLLEAYDRVLKEDIYSPLDIPPFDRSKVDGYAVRAEDTFGAEENQPRILDVCGFVNVGELPKIRISKNETVEIVTGAPIPQGADSVVMVEYTEEKNDRLWVYRAVTREENVMKRGTDIKRGELALKAGQVLGAAEIGILAALGITEIKVVKTPLIAVLSTGAEVTEPGKNLPDGKIFDINAFSLSAAVRESGGNPVYLGVIPDDKKQLQETLQKALTSTDMVITSGGVSVGPKDFTPKILASLGKPGLVVSGIAVKPGKPTTVGLIGEKPIFSLPGHPTSALLIFQLLVRPIIQIMSGKDLTKHKAVKALAAMRMFSAKGRRTFVMVKLKRDKLHQLIAEPVETGDSGAITTLAKADGYIEIQETQQFIDVNEEITVKLLRI